MSHDAQTDEELLRELLSDRLPDRRERIATAALQGLLAGDTPNGTDRHGEFWRVADYANDPEDAAKVAVALADALIAELDGVK
jgi:hypothetical protein